MSKKFKKGDWVITPYNKYPVQLEENGCFGIFDASFSGVYFFEVTPEEAKDMNKFLVYAVKDPRDGMLKREGYFSEEAVRLATKKEMNLLMDFANKQLRKAQEDLKTYKKAIKNL